MDPNVAGSSPVVRPFLSYKTPYLEFFVNTLQALILGIIQGITEFFPVSSSAHLRIAKKILSIPDGEHLLYFDLLCHAGTLIALLFYLRKEILQTLKNPKEILLFFLALLPLVPGYFLLKPVRIALSQSSYLGFFLILTSALLFAASRPKKDPLADQKGKKWKNVLWIGLAQTAALIPGISRSGSTIAAARFCGWSFPEGARFSFLLAIPTILGGELLETIKLIHGTSEGAGAVSSMSYAIGFIASLGVGLFSVRAVFWIYEREIIRPFAWYCLGIGFITLAMFHG